MSETLLRLMAYSWNGLPIASLAIFAVGGLMYLVMNRVPTSAKTRSLAVRRPGWLARRRARGGIAHRPDGVGVGYRSAFGSVHISLAELNHQGYVGGATGSGKTTFLRGLFQGFPGPAIVLDCKGDQDLAETAWDLPGLVWEIGGPLRLDLLDPEPAILAQQLLEGEAFGDRGAVYRAIAEHAIIRAGTVLRWRSQPLEPARILELMSSPTTLAEAIRDVMPPGDRMALRWLAELDEPGATIREGFQTFAERLGSLLDSPAGRSLGSGVETLRLADVVASRSKLLIRPDPRYGALSRKVGAWTLVAMLRLAAELRSARWQGRCLFVVDDPRLLQHEGRWLADLFGTARDAGIGLVIADQGIEGLAAVHPDLPNAVLRSTGWQLVFRQGSPDDAEKMSALFGTTWRDDVSYGSDGRTTTRARQEPRVYPSWLTSLPTAHAWFHGAPIGLVAEERVGLLVVATPARAEKRARLALPPGSTDPGGSDESPDGSADGSPTGTESEFESDNGISKDGRSGRAVRGGTPGTTDPDLSSVEGQKRAVYRRVKTIDGWRRWRGLFDHDGWPQMWGQRPYKLIYEWEQGPIPAQWTIDHTCGEKDCLDHLEAVTRGENLRRRHARERGELPIGHAGMLPPSSAGSAKSDPPTAEPDTETEVAPLTSEERAAAIRRLRAEGLSLRKIADELGVSYATVWRSVEAGKSAAEGTPSTRAPAKQFAIALFAGVSRPAVEQRIVSLDELRTMLNTFEVLKDKRRGRCWSPTQYADGATTRGNAGVELVSCLVFDCDRTAPDLERLGSVYWLGHTTHSHTPEAPRWRVVIPLVAPVPAAQWGNIWRRARAALCPEADPACKDPSRAYWLPSHNGGVSARATCHDGPLLDPATLPLLTEPVRPEFRRTSSSTVLRATIDADRRRGEAYMDKVIDNLAGMAPNTGRNVALNKAASTLGEWVAAGVLDLAQVEDALYAAAQANGLVAEDGQRQCWATIRSGLGHGLQHPYDLDADRG